MSLFMTLFYEGVRLFLETNLSIVPHDVFINAGIQKIQHYAKPVRVIFDVKGRFDRELVDMTL